MLQTKKLATIVCETVGKNDSDYLVMGDMNAFDPDARTPTLSMVQIHAMLAQLEPSIVRSDNTAAGNDIESGLDDHHAALEKGWLTKSTLSTFDAFPFDILFKLTSAEREVLLRLKTEDKPEAFASECVRLVGHYGTAGTALDHAFISPTIAASVRSLEAIKEPNLSDHACLLVAFQEDSTFPLQPLRVF